MEGRVDPQVALKLCAFQRRRQTWTRTWEAPLSPRKILPVRVTLDHQGVGHTKQFVLMLSFTGKPCSCLPGLRYVSLVSKSSGEDGN